MATKKPKKTVDTRDPWQKLLDMEWFHIKSKPLPRPPPENRNINVGDDVRWGAMGKSTVTDITPDGLILTLNCEFTGKANSGVITTVDGRFPRVVFWNEVMPCIDAEAETMLDVGSLDIWRKCSARQTGLESLIFNARWRGLNDSPTYQRSYVWTDEDRERLLSSIFAGLDIGKFVFVIYDWPENRLEVLDGKQRLTTLIDFWESRFPYKGVYYHELFWRDRIVFHQHSVQWIEVNGSKCTESELLRLFLAVNAGGVPQSDEHIAHVRKLYDEAVAAESKTP